MSPFTNFAPFVDLQYSMELEDCCAAAATQNDPSLLGACPPEPTASEPEDLTPTTPTSENPVVPEGLETIESIVCLHEVYETIS